MKRYCITRLAIVLLLGLGAGGSQATAQAERNWDSGKVKAIKESDDPQIPTMSELSPETDVRLFVESFLVALGREDAGVVYETYTESSFQERHEKEEFTQFCEQFRQVVGPMERLGVVHLREYYKKFDGHDGGQATYMLAYARDPKVVVEVSFLRDDEGLWHITDYGVQSTRMSQYVRARGAAEGAPEEEPTPEKP